MTLRQGVPIIMSFSHFRPALEPEILRSQIHTGNSLLSRCIISHHASGFVRLLGVYVHHGIKTFLYEQHVMCPICIVHGRVSYRGDSIR